MKRDTKNFLNSSDKLEFLDKQINYFSSGFNYNPIKRNALEKKRDLEQIKFYNYSKKITESEYNLYLAAGYGLEYKDFIDE